MERGTWLSHLTKDVFKDVARKMNMTLMSYELVDMPKGTSFVSSVSSNTEGKVEPGDGAKRDGL